MSASPIPAQCGDCRHFHFEYAPPPPGTDPCPTEAGSLRCDVFPNGIPWPIQEGEFDHTKPYPGDTACCTRCGPDGSQGWRPR